MRRLCAKAIPVLICLIMAAPAWAQNLDLGLITVKSKAKAEDIREKLIKGASFEDLAKAFSVGPAAFKGGRLGMVPTKRLRAEYRKALQGLPPNRPSYVIPTEEGYTILMTFAPRPATKPAPAPQAGPVRRPLPRKAAPKTDLKVPEIPYLAARTLVAAGVEQLSRGELGQAKLSFATALAKNPYEDSARFFQSVLNEIKPGGLSQKSVEKFATGFVFMLEGDIKRAHKLFREAAAQNKRFWQASLFEANMLADMNQPDKASAQLLDLVSRHPKAARAYVTLGLIAAEKGEIEKARQYFKKAAEIQPKLAEAHYQLSTLALLKDDFKTAEKQLLATVAANPYREEAYNDLGLVMMYTKRLAQAEKYYQKSLELDSNFVPAIMNLGQLYAMQNKLNLAVDEFNKALLVDPKLGSAHSNLATAYVLMGKWDQAIKHADAAKLLKFPLSASVEKALKPHRKAKKP